LHSIPKKEDARQRAWEIRQQHDSRIWFSAPGSKHYESRRFRNTPHSFAHVSITGHACALRCEHCNAGLLRAMLPAETPEKLRDAADRLTDRGCRGILVSGGADSSGEVPLHDFMRAIAYARKKGLKVLVHTGLLTKETAAELKDCGVNQILVDIIGHEQTIRDVYHLDRTPEDYLRSMMICREAGIDFAPHVVIGLHYGRILGEYEALKMIHRAQPKTIVMVILAPMPGTPMSTVNLPGLSDVENVMAFARVLNPDAFLSLGCAKPAGEYKRQTEMLAIENGFDGIAFPSDEAIDYACRQGRVPVFTEICCSMAGNRHDRPDARQEHSGMMK